jgi:hypothetical protein
MRSHFARPADEVPHLARAAWTLSAIVLSLAWLCFTGTPASAHEPHPGLNFWIAVDGVPNCSTKTSDATCNLAPGSAFVVGVYLGPLPHDTPNYKGFDISLKYNGLTEHQDASASAWPDCGFPASSYSQPNTVLFGCATGLPPAGPSTYTGLIGTNSFTCAQSGSVSLLHGTDITDLVQDLGYAHAEDPNTTETLTINCVAGGVTPIPTTPHAARGATSAPPGTARPPAEQATANATAGAQSTATFAAQSTEVANEKATLRARETPPGTGVIPGGGGPTGSSSGGGGGLTGGVIAIIVIAAVVVTGGAGFFGWRYAQSRRTSASNQ